MQYKQQIQLKKGAIKMKNSLVVALFILFSLTSSTALADTTSIKVTTWVNCINMVPSVHIAECKDSIAKGKAFTFTRESESPQQATTSYSLNSFERTSSPVEEQVTQPQKEDSYLSSLGGTIWFMVLLVIGLSIYFLPFIIAANRNHDNGSGIFVLNLFLGWTLIGWVVALIWAVSETKKADDSKPYTPPITPTTERSNMSDVFNEVEKLSLLHKSGHITDEEFATAKRKILGI